MGLASFAYPWGEGEEAWVLLRRPDVEEMSKMSDGGASAADSYEDLHVEALADVDSKFVDLCGIRVRYHEIMFL